MFVPPLNLSIMMGQQLQYLSSHSPLSPASYVSLCRMGTLAHEPEKTVFPPSLEL